MLVGSYYCFDIPAAIKQQIDDYLGDPGDYETLFSLLYTLYAAPNVILPFFGGYFVDRFGVRLCLLIFTSLIALGQVVVSFGISIKSWPVILTGRLIFGFGGESLTVANSALLAEWFRGRELAFAFGINLSVAKLGSVINNLVSPALAKSTGVVFACWFGAILCGLSVLFVVITMPIDRHMDEKIRAEAEQMDVEENKKALISHVEHTNSNHATNSLVNPSPPTQLRDCLSFPVIFWVLAVSCVVIYGCVLPFNNISSSLLLERDYFKLPPPACHLYNPEMCQSDATGNIAVDCPSSEWVQPPLPHNVSTECGFYPGQLKGSDIDCTKSCWSDGCASLYCRRLSKGESQASVIMSIPYIISGVLSPFLGLAIDKFGLRAVIACIAPAILVIVHLLLGFSDVSPVGPLVGQGMAYTGFAAVLWPAVPLVVEDRLTGLGFGVITSLQNLGCAVIPLVVAAIFNVSNEKYIPNVEILFAGLACIGFVVGLYMNYYDYTHNSILNRACPPEEVLLAARLSVDDEDVRVAGYRSSSDRRSSSDARGGRSASQSRGSFTPHEEANRGGAYDHLHALRALSSAD